MRLSIAEVAKICNGDWRDDGNNRFVVRASIDSRDQTANALFVPLVGVRDGHDFLEDAIANGCVAHLCSDTSCTKSPAVVVSDCGSALTTLAISARSTFEGRVIGVTGSVGKTTTKDMVASICSTSFVTEYSTRSFNNEIGVSLTVANAAGPTEIMVVEMGARQRGDIRSLARIAKPHIGVVTRVVPAHIGVFGSLTAIVQTKAELVRALPSSGYAILNADDANVLRMRRYTDASVLTFGAEGDVRAERIVLDDRLRPEFVLKSSWGDTAIKLNAPGAHMIANALAAAATGLVSGVGLDDVARGLSTVALSRYRMEISQNINGACVVNDCYNANGASMRAGLDALLALPAKRRIAFLGKMDDVGAYSAKVHREIAEYARRNGIELIAVETAEYDVPETSIAKARATLLDLCNDDAALIKASRSAAFERIGKGVLVDLRDDRKAGRSGK